MKKEVDKLTEIYRYGLIATEYYRRGYGQCRKDTLNNIRKKYDLINIDEMCEETEKEYNQE